MLRVTTDYGLHFVTNKKVHSLADYFNQISLKEKVKIDSIVLREATEFIKGVCDMISNYEYFLTTSKWLCHFPIGGFK